MSTIDQQAPYLRELVRDHWLTLLIFVIPINVAVGAWVHDWPWFTLVATVPIVSAVLG